MKNATQSISPRLRVLDLRDLATFASIPQRRVYQLLSDLNANPRFPRPFKMGRRLVWRQHQIEAYLDALERKTKVG